jgi:hypothetical protein
MRRVLHQDVVALARCLLCVGKMRRAAYARRCIQAASEADRWRLSTGRAHPVLGDGTLQSACAGLPKAAEGYPDDPDYAACLVVALQAVIHARSTACASNALG